MGPQGRGEAAPPCPLRVERIHAVLCWPPALGPRQGVVGLGTPRLTASCGVARGSQGGTTAEDQGCARELSRGQHLPVTTWLWEKGAQRTSLGNWSRCATRHHHGRPRHPEAPSCGCHFTKDKVKGGGGR